MDLINNTISGKITKEKIELFSKTLVKEDSYRDYLWTWCGRYSVPLGLMTVFNLGNLNNIEMHGMLLKYSSSISTPPIPVEFAGMGVTAPAAADSKPAPSDPAGQKGFTVIGYCENNSQQLDAMNALRMLGIRCVAK